MWSIITVCFVPSKSLTCPRFLCVTVNHATLSLSRLQKSNYHLNSPFRQSSTWLHLSEELVYWSWRLNYRQWWPHEGCMFLSMIRKKAFQNMITAKSASTCTSDVQNDPGHANCAMKAKLSNCILTIIIQIIKQKCLQLHAYMDLHVQSFRPHIILITVLDSG